MSYNIINDDESKIKRLSAEMEALKAKKEKDYWSNLNPKPTNVIPGPFFPPPPSTFIPRMPHREIRAPPTFNESEFSINDIRHFDFNHH